MAIRFFSPEIGWINSEEITMEWLPRSASQAFPPKVL
jgi:hypothetical protein